MIGLPTEEDEDVRGIVEIGKRARADVGKARRKGPRPPKVTVSVSTHVPKPHTPVPVVRDGRACRGRSESRACFADATRAQRRRSSGSTTPTTSVLEGRLRARRSTARRRPRARLAQRRALRLLGGAAEARRLARGVRGVRHRSVRTTSAPSRSPRACRGTTSTSASRTAFSPASTARR